jgi:hypothetical protein
MTTSLCDRPAGDPAFNGVPDGFLQLFLSLGWAALSAVCAGKQARSSSSASTNRSSSHLILQGKHRTPAPSSAVGTQAACEKLQQHAPPTAPAASGCLLTGTTIRQHPGPGLHLQLMLSFDSLSPFVGLMMTKTTCPPAELQGRQRRPHRVGPSQGPGLVGTSPCWATVEHMMPPCHASLLPARISASAPCHEVAEAAWLNWAATSHSSTLTKHLPSTNTLLTSLPTSPIALAVVPLQHQACRKLPRLTR